MEKEEVKKAIENVSHQEKRYGYTLVGPHRDDLIIEVDGHSVVNSMSQGQIRNVVVSLKLATLDYLEKVTKEKPIMLLDEVLSELDEKRQELLLKNLPNVQTLLTCTFVPDVLRKRSNVHLLDLRTILESEELKDGEDFSEEEQLIEEATV